MGSDGIRGMERNGIKREGEGVVGIVMGWMYGCDGIERLERATRDFKMIEVLGLDNRKSRPSPRLKGP